MPTIIEGDFIMRNASLILIVAALLLGTAGCSSSNESMSNEPSKIEEQNTIELVTKNKINEEEFQEIDNLTEGQDDMKVKISGIIKKVYKHDKYVEIMLDECNDTAYPLIVVVPTTVLNNDIEFQEGEEIIVYGRIDGLNYKEEVPYIKLSAYGIKK